MDTLYYFLLFVLFLKRRTKSCWFKSELNPFLCEKFALSYQQKLLRVTVWRFQNVSFPVRKNPFDSGKSLLTIVSWLIDRKDLLLTFWFFFLPPFSRLSFFIPYTFVIALIYLRIRLCLTRYFYSWHFIFYSFWIFLFLFFAAFSLSLSLKRLKGSYRNRHTDIHSKFIGSSWKKGRMRVLLFYFYELPTHPRARQHHLHAHQSK